MTQTIPPFLLSLALFLAIQFFSALHSDFQAPIQKGSTIRGVVTYADTGRPVRYAIVRLFNDDQTKEWDTAGTTDRHGEFGIPNIPAGRYIVYVDSPGILKLEIPAGGGSKLARLRLTGQSFTEVVVNGTDSVDVKVQAVRGGVITGRVVTEDDQPVANADIKLLKHEDGKWLPLQPWGRFSPGEPSKTDPSGVYRIAGLIAGEYLVRVSEGDAKSDGRSQPEDGTYTDGSFMTAYYPASTTIKDAQPVTVIEGSESSGIDIRMPERPPHTISGIVKFGPDDEPAVYADILIERADEIGYSETVFGSSTVRSDEEGKWEVRGVPAGDYSIKFGGSVRVGVSEQNQRGYVNIAPKRVVARVEYDDVVVPEVKLSEGSSISGKVTWEGPPPKDFYRLRPRAVPATQLSAADSAQGSENWLAPGITGATLSEKGEFWIPGLAAGKYSVLLSGYDEDRYYVRSVTRKGVDLKQSTLKVGEDSEITDVVIALASDFATVEGQLTPSEASAKLDVEHAVVILAPANDATRRINRGLITMQPDARGKFGVKCPPGDYFLTAVTAAEIKQRAKPFTEDDFKKENQKFERVKVKGGEKVKGLTLRAASN